MGSAKALLAVVAVCAAVAVCEASGSGDSGITNKRVFLDMIQNNPGDPMAWQQSHWQPPAARKAIGVTGIVPTGELAPTLSVDYAGAAAAVESFGRSPAASVVSVQSGGQADGGDSPYFPAGSPERAWLDAMATGIDAAIARADAAGVEFVPFVDMLVFPRSLVAAFPNMTDGKNIVWNNVTAALLQLQLEQVIARFPGVDGILVRTGETYVYDNPYHMGNSPVASVHGQAEQVATWVEVIEFVKNVVCVKNNRALYWRAWDSFAGWTGDPIYYLNVTNPIEPHPLLYFSIKHTAGDFFRFMRWNGQLAVGRHAQIVEIELQREYEGKGAIPNYVIEGIINGFDDLGPAEKIGIKDIIGKPQLRGLWTWSRGGGWWGPYIHGRELWIDLHFMTLANWWAKNGTITEEQAFQETCQQRFALDPASQACSSMRQVALQSAVAMLHGHYCPVLNGSDPCWSWTRDDRLGGSGQLSGHFSKLYADNLFEQSLAFKRNATQTALAMMATYESDIGPAIANEDDSHYLNTSLQYGFHWYNIVESAWNVWSIGYTIDKGQKANMTELNQTIATYDRAWAAYRGFGLQRHDAPSLYRPVYFNLPGGEPSPGMDDWVNKYRNMTLQG